MNHSLFFLSLGAFGFFTSLGNAENWKLQPLEYNNPGLVVDLGVGLWAWPLPMDYDGDGDMDLLSTRGNSAPYDGVFWLEQVRTTKPTPRFKAARSQESEEVALP